jgi:HTH-type transcriptional regulator/antitoxin HigA
VVVIIEKELPKARVKGVARWLSPNEALIQLSARYLRDDVLWFTFFHEAGHLPLHGRKSGPRDIPATFIDTKDSTGHAEDEASTFAADLLIPPSYAERLRHVNSLDDVRQLADDLRISPGIIVGGGSTTRNRSGQSGTRPDCSLPMVGPAVPVVAIMIFYMRCK